jgi:DNA invertase Pin-like site-specific DNA recombinase
MKIKAKTLWVEIVDILTESMSAKAPWRYRFNEMIQRINDWEANWIIAWKLDRISRNPIDSWTIQYMLQTWKLNRVITNDREYNPIDAWLLMSVENGMSNQFLLDLSKNVKRWVKSKAEKGWFPWPAPLWYENELKYHTIIKDEDKFTLVQKMWKMMLSWNYSVNQITNIANDKWGLRTKKNCKVNKSTIYAIFHNVFYTGDFKWKWKIMKWNHLAMISYEEYNRIQELLQKDWKPKLVKHNFAFTWIIKCAECWSMITAWNKYKHIKTTNTIKTYSYYFCTKKVSFWSNATFGKYTSNLWPQIFRLGVEQVDKWFE